MSDENKEKESKIDEKKENKEEKNNVNEESKLEERKKRFRIMEENNEVFKQGDYPTYFYILKEGECDLYIDINLDNKLMKKSRPNGVFNLFINSVFSFASHSISSDLNILTI